MTALCQKILEEKKWPQEWNQSLVIPLSKWATSKFARFTATSASLVIPAKSCYASSLID
ncbi:hypothetical protein DPMN_152359 [Dreissena polymorpha]|uniref:Uncharacterized protein n=1 Tax=Dreissena polymorpha TaxID=45954 RepID=A0A9D4J3T0_DREPO|nr:hypothetical protein DPMN_152359 [Dreissena polymorpha]